MDQKITKPFSDLGAKVANSAKELAEQVDLIITCLPSPQICAEVMEGNEGILDGFIYVKGNVGNDSFQRVRRGNIIIDGNIGNDACREMISGSILIKGSIGNSFGIDIKRGSIFIKDRKLTRDYTQSNDAEYNFIKFYLTQLKSILKKKIFLEKKKLKRYYGNKDKNNLSEIFLFTA